MKQTSKRARTEDSASGKPPLQQPKGKEGGESQPGHPARAKPEWKWHYRVLLGLRDRLLEARSEQLHEAAEPMEVGAVDAAESATEEFDHDLALGKLSSEQDALYEVEEALRRIGNGAYGICEETGRPIEAGRLKAVPWTRFSHDAEARLEKEGVIQRTRFGKVASVRKPKSDMLWKNGIPGGQDTEEDRPPDSAEGGSP
jgi:RNA polymerase-binding transcription factor DksA